MKNNPMKKWGKDTVELKKKNTRNIHNMLNQSSSRIKYTI